jgi:hypothetical protein
MASIQKRAEVLAEEVEGVVAHYVTKFARRAQLLNFGETIKVTIEIVERSPVIVVGLADAIKYEEKLTDEDWEIVLSLPCQHDDILQTIRDTGAIRFDRYDNKTGTINAFFQRQQAPYRLINMGWRTGYVLRKAK